MLISEYEHAVVPPAPVADEVAALRVAIFSDTFAPQVNGVTRTLERLCGAIEARGGVAHVFTPSDPDADASAQVSRYASIPFWAYGQLRMAWPSSRQVRADVQAFRPTIIHAATPFGMGLAARRAAREFGIPFVSSYHTSFSAYAHHYGMPSLAEPLWRYLRWFHNAAARTYCPSESTRAELAARGILNTSVWSRGVDARLFSPVHRSTALRAMMGANPSSLVVTYVGRLAVEKGLDVAAAAVRQAASERPGAIVFSCVGDGPFDNELRRMAPDASWLPGKLSGHKLSEAYASGDVFLFPSTTDTFGNVLVEAMASGLPVLGADVGPTRELVGRDRGWLVPAGDVQAFARVLVQLVDDNTLRIAPRSRAIEFAQANSWDTIWDQLLRDYVEVVRH
jgi:glycosyltransferase involved in cell wall biosynthesis